MQMKVYTSAADFRAQAGSALEKAEAANNLMLGLIDRIERFPERLKSPPYLAAVADEHGLIAAALMTPPHNVVVYADRPEREAAFEAIARHLLAEKWSVPGVVGPERDAEAFACVWAALTGQALRMFLNMRVFELRQVISPRPTAGAMRLATLEDLELTAEWLLAFNEEALKPILRSDAEEIARSKINDGDYYLWVVDHPVSLTGVGRRTAHGVSIGPVYTPPEQRSKGYASACVAAVSQKMLDSGCEFCALFTDLKNPTSNKIYQDVGYRPLCDFKEIHFLT